MSSNCLQKAAERCRAVSRDSGTQLEKPAMTKRSRSVRSTEAVDTLVTSDRIFIRTAIHPACSHSPNLRNHVLISIADSLGTPSETGLTHGNSTEKDAAHAIVALRGL